jgi:hypothetical protein
MSSDFYGLKTQSLENDSLRLDYLSESGPRIVRLCLKNSGKNLLVELPEAVLDSSAGDFHLRGGHRLWHSPEYRPRTYLPDDDPIRVERLEDGVRLVQPVEQGSGIQKNIEIHLPASGTHFTLAHSLVNEGPWPVELAPWAISMLPLGGVALLPFQPASSSKTGLLHDRRLSLWPYTQVDDPRLMVRDAYIALLGQPRPTAVKIGIFNSFGLEAYYCDRTLLIKRFDPQEGQVHPDFGCNSEVYIKDTFTELESLGAMTLLEPGQAAFHTEKWEIYPGLDYAQSEDGIAALFEFIQTL